MISRRDVLKLGAAGVIGATSGSSATLNTRSSAQAPTSSVPMSRGNAARTGVMPGPAPSLDKPIVVKWKFDTGGSLDQRPRSVVVSNNTLYTVSSHDKRTLVALNAHSGQEIWRTTNKWDFGWHEPIVYGGNLYATSHGLFAYDAQSGERLWRFGEDHLYSDPTIENGVIYLGSDGTLDALDADSGNSLWSFETKGRVHTPAAVSDGVVYACDGINLHAIDAISGNELWRFNEDISPSSPVVSEGVVYVNGNDSDLYAIDTETGYELWRSKWGGSTLAANDGVLVSGTGNVFSRDTSLMAVSTQTGQELWKTNQGGALPVFVGNTVFAGGPDYLGSFDALTGEELWRYSTEEDLGSSPAVVNGVIYVGSGWGNVYAIGNLMPTVLITDVELKGAPSESGISRGHAKNGDEITGIRDRTVTKGQDWVEVTIGDLTGWIPLDSIDPATLPPEGEIEYVHVPE